MSAPTPARNALYGVLAGTAGGAAAAALVLARVRQLVDRLPAADVNARGGTALTLLLFGTFGAVVLGAVLAWWRVGAMPTLFRRAALALAAGLGTILAAMLAVPLHQLAGRTGLLVFAALAALAALLFLRPRAA